MKQLNADIRNRDFRQAYLLYGEESFLKRSYRKRLKAAMMGGDEMNVVTFDGRETDLNAVIDAAETMPLFAERKLLVLTDTGWFRTGGNDLADYLKQANPAAYWIFAENEVDRRSRLFQQVSAMGYVCEMNHPEPAELSQWAAGVLAQDGKRITRTDMERFLEQTGNDMELVHRELEKLIGYTGDRPVVTGDDIAAVTTVTATNRVYEMCRAITQHKQAEAMRLYEDLLALRETPMSIIYKIARQFNQLLQVKDLLQRGQKQDAIAEKLHLSSYVTGKLIRQVREYDRNMLLNIVENCVELEAAVKTGDMPERLAVELLICR